MRKVNPIRFALLSPLIKQSVGACHLVDYYGGMLKYLSKTPDNTPLTSSDIAQEIGEGVSAKIVSLVLLQLGYNIIPIRLNYTQYKAIIKLPKGVGIERV